MKNVKIAKVKKIEAEPSTSFEKMAEALGKISSKAGYVVVDTWLGEEDMKKITSKKVINTVQPEFEGEYKLKIKGNRISLIKDGIYVSSKCHPEDKFDIGEGVNKCFERLGEKMENSKIEIGDFVKVVNNEYSYTTYTDWLYKYLNFTEVRNFKYGNIPMNGTVGKVIAVNSHLKMSHCTLVAIKTIENKVYLIDIDAVKKVK